MNSFLCFSKNLTKKAESPTYQVILLLFIAFAVFHSSLFGGPIFDDNSYIFKSTLFTSAASALDFWNPYNPRYRSWPASYSALWLIYSFAKNNYWIYKLINLLLHTLNASLVLYTCRSLLKIKNYFIITIIFLIHPIQIETLSWIFQLKTILATTFFLLSYIALLNFNQNRRAIFLILSIYFYFFSLASKSIAILYPFFFLITLYIKKSNRNFQNLFFIAPFFFLSLIYGMDAIKGITINNPLEAYAQQIFKKTKEIKTSDVVNLDVIFQPLPHTKAPKEKSIPQVQQKPEVFPNSTSAPNIPENTFNKGLTQAQKKSTSTPNTDYKERIFQKLKKIIYNQPVFAYSFYLVHFFAPLRPSLIYGTFSLKQQLLFILLGFLLLTSIYYFTPNKRHFFMGLLAYTLSVLPIVGFIYIPYMKYSLVADHWAYLSTLPLSIIFLFSLQKCKFKKIILFTFISLLTIRSYTYCQVFNHKFRVLHNALSSAPSEPLLYIELSNLYLNDHQLKKAEDVLISGLKKNDLKKNPFLLMQIGYIYRQTKKIELLKKVLQKLFTIFSEKGRYDLAEQVKLELNSL